MEKLKRAANFTATEEDLLITLVIQKQNILECKKTDVNSSKSKELAWAALANDFNANSTTFRDATMLRRKYENLKKRSKQKYAQEKCNLTGGTGGGSPVVITITAVDESIKNILGTQLTGMTSQFDDDCTITQDTSEASVVLPDTQSELLKVPDHVTTNNNWSKYSPNMLRSPRSIELMPSSLKNKILNSGSYETGEPESLSAGEKPTKNTPELVKEVETQNLEQHNSRCTVIPRTTRTPKRKNADTEWTRVAQVKLELLKLQKQHMQEDHALKMEFISKENKLKLEMLEVELENKKKKYNL